MTFRSFILVSAAALTGGLAGACSTDGAAQRSEARVADADAVLAGYTATGGTRSCLSLRNIDQIDRLDGTRWLVTTRGGGAYLNTVSRGCQSAANNFTYLEYETPTGNLCNNEIVRVRDRSSGMIQGSCGLGQFQELEPIDDDA